MTDLALVTGASSGIGRAFAQRLAADGYDSIVVGRRKERLDELAASLPNVRVQVVTADLATDDGVDSLAEVCAREPITMLVNNAGVAHYMPMAELSAAQARELVHVKVVSPTMLSRAVVSGMLERGTGTIVNVAGMIAFSGPAPSTQMPRRAVYSGTLAHIVAVSQTLSAELDGTGVRVQVVCPGVVGHRIPHRPRDGSLRRAEDDGRGRGDRIAARSGVGRGGLRAGVEDIGLLHNVFDADLAAFGAQNPQLAERYRAS